MSNRTYSKIITVGLSPAWDAHCRGDEINWGRHCVVDEKTVVPAGKALNVSKALAWLGCKSIATGLWGSDDYQMMRNELKKFSPAVRCQFTKTPGRTRENITIVNPKNKKEMHLRFDSSLATKASIKKLKNDIVLLMSKKSIIVFAGAMPQDGYSVVDLAKKNNCKIALDTSGDALVDLVDKGGLWLIKPNVQEFRQIVGNVKDSPNDLKNKAIPLLDKCENIVISRGKNGAMVINKTGCWVGRLKPTSHKVRTTVACGDYFLAGFLAAVIKGKKPDNCLRGGMKTATAKAFGFDRLSSTAALSKVKLEIKRISL